MASIIKKSGRPTWLSDTAIRTKIKSALIKILGSENDKINRFFEELDKEESQPSGASRNKADAEFVRLLTESIQKKGLNAMSGDDSKKINALANKITFEVKYKSNVIQLMVNGKQLIGVV